MSSVSVNKSLASVKVAPEAVVKAEDEANDGEDADRGNWGSPVEFILSCLGYAVGLGNVWRFPYLCYMNGGGAFLIPYFIMLTFVGITTFMIELTVGQYSGSGPVNVWEASPLFQGVGVGMVVISFIGSIYYNMIIAWSLYYLFASWQSVLPWSTCTHDYNTGFCYALVEAEPCEKYENDTLTSNIWFNQTCYVRSELDLEKPGEYNCTFPNDTVYSCPYSEWFRQDVDNLRKTSSEEYFNYGMLRRSETMEDTGELQWDLTLCLLLSWIICFLCLIKGIKSAGKVVYVTATFPYLILVILFVRGVTLPGALEGIKFYIIPEWEKLATPKVWADAAGQIFFSLSVGMGGLMTFASYNKFHNNVYRDTLIVAIGNCMTSFFAGFVIFSILGYMAQLLNTTVDKVAASGSGLAFIAYPEVVTHLPLSQLWATLFFLMLLTLGLDSQFAGIENIMTAIVDNVTVLRPRKHFVAGGLCVFMFLIGLPMCTNAGVYWVEVMSYYSSGWSLVLMGTAEAIVFPWVYGTRRLMADIELMVGFELKIHWWVCWTIITPILLMAILIFNMVEFTPLSYGDYLLPDWAQALGWLMAVVSVVMIPIVAVVKVIRSYRNPDYDGVGGLHKRIAKLTRPTDKWLPTIEKNKMNKAGDLEKNGDVNIGYVSHHDNPGFTAADGDTTKPTENGDSNATL